MPHVDNSGWAAVGREIKGSWQGVLSWSPSHVLSPPPSRPPPALCRPHTCRSSEERKEDSAWSLMLSNGVIKTYDVNGHITEVRPGGVGGKGGLPPLSSGTLLAASVCFL